LLLLLLPRHVLLVLLLALLLLPLLHHPVLVVSRYIYIPFLVGFVCAHPSLNRAKLLQRRPR